MDKNVITGLDSRADNQRAVACRGRHKQAGGLLVAPALWNSQHAVLLGHGLGGICALSGPEDPGANGKFGVPGVGGRGQHDTRKLGTGDPREGWRVLVFDNNSRRCVLTRLVLVFALDLQDIKKVGRRGVDLDEVLVRGRLGVRKIRHPELMGSLERQLI